MGFLTKKCRNPVSRRRTVLQDLDRLERRQSGNVDLGMKYKGWKMKRVCILSFLALAACNSENVATLYKKGLDKTERIHIATFDTEGGFEANNTSCAAITVLLEQQDAMNRYWCEQGRYHK